MTKYNEVCVLVKSCQERNISYLALCCIFFTTCPLYATTAICDKLPRYIIVAIILVPMSFSGRDLAPVQPPNISGFFEFLQCLFWYNIEI